VTNTRNGFQQDVCEEGPFGVPRALWRESEFAPVGRIRLTAGYRGRRRGMHRRPKSRTPSERNAPPCSLPPGANHRATVRQASRPPGLGPGPPENAPPRRISHRSPLARLYSEEPRASPSRPASPSADSTSSPPTTRVPRPPPPG
jgi:hypothetical protein